MQTGFWFAFWLGFLVCLILVGSAVAAVVVWRQEHPRKRWVA